MARMLTMMGLRIQLLMQIIDDDGATADADTDAALMIMLVGSY